MYNCVADNPDELTFSEGEVIVVDGEEDQEWWVSITTLRICAFKCSWSCCGIHILLLVTCVFRCITSSQSISLISNKHHSFLQVLSLRVLFYSSLCSFCSWKDIGSHDFRVACCHPLPVFFFLVCLETCLFNVPARRFRAHQGSDGAPNMASDTQSQTLPTFCYIQNMNFSLV